MASVTLTFRSDALTVTAGIELLLINTLHAGQERLNLKRLIAQLTRFTQICFCTSRELLFSYKYLNLVTYLV